MKEIRDIIQSFEKAKKENKKTALATVVHIEGSSYRQPGARMLITIDGMLTGAISGGCLEGDALRKALLVMSNNKPMLVTYDTNDEDDAKLGVGLGCNGIIQILIEPVDTDDPENPVEMLKKLVSKRQKAVLITIFNLEDRRLTQYGTVQLFLEDGERIGSPGIESLQEFIENEVITAFKSEESKIKTFKSDLAYTVFTEFISPAISMVIIGAGNDVIPLESMARILGWETTVVDGRANYATYQRFPDGTRLLVAKPGEVLSQLSIDNRTVVLLMTHNYNYDLAMLNQLMNTHTPYIGVLGPRKKTLRLLEEMQMKGKTLSEEELSRIYGPVGIEIGAETAEEIALSICTEIKAVMSGKQINSLRNVTATIHAHGKQKIETVHIKAIE
jgi:xanthine/CO dehydrogenase XdhC/CoxF family maturation factor